LVLNVSQAPGEAEAELAVMNRQGKIDAVMSDDVDALLFGATCLLRKCLPPVLLRPACPLS
jgi:Holliday junction resolvase YEN1